MRVTDFSETKDSRRCRVSAKVAWEVCDYSGYDIVFETEPAYADALTCNPNAFLLATAIPAWFYGEKRVLIDGEICPELTDGLLTAMSWIQHWFKKLAGIPGIEAKQQKTLPEPRTQERAACFFSEASIRWPPSAPIISVFPQSIHGGSKMVYWCTASRSIPR